MQFADICTSWFARIFLDTIFPDLRTGIRLLALYCCRLQAGCSAAGVVATSEGKTYFLVSSLEK